MFIIFFVCFLFSENYTNNEIGFVLEFPKELKIIDKNNNFYKLTDKDNNSYNILIFNHTEWLTSEKTLNKHRYEFFNKIYFKNIPDEPQDFVEEKNVDNIKILITSGMGGDGLAPVVRYIISFFKNNNFISIVFTKNLELPPNKIDSEVMNKYNQYKENEMKNVNFKNLFNLLLENLKFSNIKTYYFPLINNLIFRELPGTGSKSIRSLILGERLEFFEEGKSEVINNIKGNWIKVRTINNEIGWCFSGYLMKYFE